MLDISEYLAAQQKPKGVPIMLQTWKNLFFLHTPIPAEIVQATLPDELTVDTFPDENGVEMAWVGFVPFEMCDVRFNGLPSLKTISNFPETNLRTYVHRNGKDPGVWFYSLEAASPIACKIARTCFGLPYHEGDMSVTESDNQLIYEGVRLSNTEVRNKVSLSKPRESDGAKAAPGTLEFFLAERYRLYAKRGGNLFTGRVWHPPYQVVPVVDVQISENIGTLIFPNLASYSHKQFCHGVNVEIFLARGVK